MAGIGKSFLVKHLALKLMNKEDAVVIYIDVRLVLLSAWIQWGILLLQDQILILDVMAAPLGISFSEWNADALLSHPCMKY